MSFAKSYRAKLALVLIAVMGLWTTPNAEAQSFILAEDQDNPDLIMHSQGYTGTGGVLNISVGIDPTSVNAAQMMVSVQNVVDTWNGLTATTGNLQFGVIDNSQIDFESVLLHEMGHSLGLGHVNLASESGLGADDQNFSVTSLGVDGIYNLGIGADGVRGSSDDIRGDDVNFNFFEIGVNNPFTVNAIVDSTTYSNDIANLPGGDTFVANGDRDVADLLGFANTEAVMQQGSFFGELQHSLAASDVIGLRYAMSGLDEIQGTADDYTVNLQFLGMDAGADIVIDFDNMETGFAVSRSSFTSINPDHWRILGSNIYFNSGFNWNFSTAAIPEPGSLALLGLASCGLLVRRRRS